MLILNVAAALADAALALEVAAADAGQKALLAALSGDPRAEGRYIAGEAYAAAHAALTAFS